MSTAMYAADDTRQLKQSHEHMYTQDKHLNVTRSWMLWKAPSSQGAALPPLSLDMDEAELPGSSLEPEPA